jgi:hypothetical protein
MVAKHLLFPKSCAVLGAGCWVLCAVWKPVENCCSCLECGSPKLFCCDDN